MAITVEELAEQILNKSYQKIQPVIQELAEKYKLDKSQLFLIGVGGGAASLIEYCAEKMEVNYSIPENAEVISSIGVALSMIRESVERVEPNPTPEDIRNIRKEVLAKVVENGADPETVDIHIEVDSTTSRFMAIATGSAEVKSTDLLKECSLEEAKEIAAKDMNLNIDNVSLEQESKHFYVFTAEAKGKKLIRILDKKGFIKVQRSNGVVVKVKAKEYQQSIKEIYDELTIYKADSVVRPDFYLCIGPRVMDFDSNTELKQNLMLMDVIVQDIEEDDDIIITGVTNEI